MRAVALAVLLATASPALAGTIVERGAVIERGQTVGAPIIVQLDAIPTGSLVTMLLRDVMGVPYVIAPEVLSDRRPTSVNLRMPPNEVPLRVVSYLRKAGFTVELQGGTVYVGRRGSAFGAASFAPSPSPGFSVPMGAPVEGLAGFPASPAAAPPPRGGEVIQIAASPMSAGPPGRLSPSGPLAEKAAPEALAGYVPAHRSVSYLVGVIGPLLPRLTFGARNDVQPNNDRLTINPELAPDVLVMAGPSDDLERAKALCELLDKPRAMVAVKAVVMQVSDVHSRGSALSILAKLGGGKVSLGSYSAEPAAAQFVRLSTGALTAMLSAVREDSRVKIVATPNLAALSGAVATINAGAQVPTLGNVTVDNGTAVQSVVYRDSGVTLTVRPIVRGDVIELDVQQERSSFAKTTTGVQDSPTLNKSSATASVVLKSGESVVLAGLTEKTEGQQRAGLLGGLLGVRSRDQNDSELLVVLQAELVPMPKASPGQFISIGKAKDDDDRDATDPLAPVTGRARTAPRAVRGQ